MTLDHQNLKEFILCSHFWLTLIVFLCDSKKRAIHIHTSDVCVYICNYSFITWELNKSTLVTVILLQRWRQRPSKVHKWRFNRSYLHLHTYLPTLQPGGLMAFFLELCVVSPFVQQMAALSIKTATANRKLLYTDEYWSIWMGKP